MAAVFALRVGPITGDEASTPAAAALALRSAALRSALGRYFGRHVYDPSEVEDLVQDVFLRIVRRGDLGQVAHLDGYIFETASSVLKDRGRRRKARLMDRHVEFQPEIHAESTTGPDAQVLSREALGAASRALMELPERTRQVFVLRRLEHLSYKEIAQRLGLSVSAIEKHMVRAVSHLMARMGEGQ